MFYEYLFNTEEPVTVTEAFHMTLKSLNHNVQNLDLTMIPHLTTKKRPDFPISLIFEKT